jgi:hypothetical protein
MVDPPVNVGAVYIIVTCVLLLTTTELTTGAYEKVVGVTIGEILGLTVPVASSLTA